MCDIEPIQGGYIIHSAPPQDSFVEKVKRVLKKVTKKKKS